MRVDILFTLFVNNIVLFYFHNTAFRVSAKSGNSGKSGKSQGNAFCLKISGKNQRIQIILRGNQANIREVVSLFLQ